MTSISPTSPTVRTKTHIKWQLLIAWFMLLVVWIATPFTGDDALSLVHLIYNCYLVVAVVFGLYFTWRQRSVLLGMATALTPFAWIIMILIGSTLFGM